MEIPCLLYLDIWLKDNKNLQKHKNTTISHFVIFVQLYSLPQKSWRSIWRWLIWIGTTWEVFVSEGKWEGILFLPSIFRLFKIPYFLLFILSFFFDFISLFIFSFTLFHLFSTLICPHVKCHKTQRLLHRTMSKLVFISQVKQKW